MKLATLAKGVPVRMAVGQSKRRFERPFRIEALHFVALFNIVVAQPLLSGDARISWYFVTERASLIDLLALLGLLCLFVPACVVAVEAVIQRFNPRVREILHTIMMMALVFLLTMQALSRLTSLPIPQEVVASWLVALLGILLYTGVLPAHQFVTYLSIAILIVPANFMWRSGLYRQVLPSAAPASAAVTVNNPAPVVMLVFDEFPLVSLLDADHQIDSNLYPNFAALARDGYWFRDATAVSDYTYQAVPAILTGDYPNPNLLPSSQDHPENIFTLLGGTFAEHVVEPITHLCPQSLCAEPTPSRSQRFHQTIANLFGLPVPSVVTATNRIDSFPQFLQNIGGDAEPALYFEHIEIPHEPWQRLPDGKLYTTSATTNGLNAADLWSDDPWLIAQGYQRHLLQVQYADTLLGQVVDRLKATGLYDQALVVVVADHGADFTAGKNRRSFAPDEAASIMPVPLLIKRPGQQAGVVSDDNVQTIDILPTVADVLGITLPWNVDGRSVFSSQQAIPAHKILISAAGQRYEFGPTVDGIDALLHQKADVFGASPTPEDLYRIGKYRGLIGTADAALPSDGNAAGVGFQLDDAGALAGVDLDSEFVPTLVEGELSGQSSSAAPAYLAVVVNGVVSAVTRTFVAANSVRFAAMIPESVLKNGSNSVELFEISGPEREPRVARIAS